MLHTNADSLPNKLIELCDVVRLSEDTPHIIAVTEVKPKNCRYGVTKSEISLDGYNLHTKNEENKTGRGIALYVHNSLKAAPMNKQNDSEEEKWIEIRLQQDDNFIIGCIYQSPNSASENNDRLNESITNICQEVLSHILITGDFNYGVINWECDTKKGSRGSKTDIRNIGTQTQGHNFLKTTKDGYLFQHIKKDKSTWFTKT